MTRATRPRIWPSEGPVGRSSGGRPSPGVLSGSGLVVSVPWRNVSNSILLIVNKSKVFKLYNT